MFHSITFTQVGLLFFTALFLSILFVPLTIRLAHRLGVVDHPSARSSHSRVVTRLGGLGIAGAFVISFMLFIPLNEFFWGFLSGFFIILLTGLADDFLNVHHRWKFVGEILAALVFIAMTGETLENLGNFLGGGVIHAGAFAIPLTVFCMVGGMNALNLVDGLDGLAAGIAAIALTFFTYLAWKVQAPYLMIISVAMLGALLGFLRYNSHPARLFMGDTGSLLLGYTLSVILVRGSQIDDAAVPLAAWVLVVGLPLLDILLVMGRRIMHGESPFSPDRTHLHHRLLLARLPHAAVVGIIYFMTALFGWLAIGLLGFPDWVMFAGLFILGFVVYSAVFELQHAADKPRDHWENRFLRGSRQQLDRLRTRLRRVSFHTAPVSTTLMILLVLPSLFYPVIALQRSQTLALLMLAGIVVLLCLNVKKENKAILHGVVYVALMSLIFLYNLAPDESGRWLHVYVGVLSALSAAWIALKLLLRTAAVPLKTSSFELLILFISAFLPLVFFDELHFPEHTVEAGRFAALEAIPLLIVSKIYFQYDNDKHTWLVRLFALTIAVVAVRGYFA
jgi:UDP-GlcNAc:undecaprenyl-phosphate GlcNAc-1-phosphate transferase